MQTLYAILALDRTDAEVIRRDAEALIRESGHGGGRTCAAAVSCDPNDGRWWVELNVDSLTQEDVGRCWDILVDSHVRRVRRVWISTYDARSIGQVGPLRPISINGRSGFVLSHDEFDAFLDR